MLDLILDLIFPQRTCCLCRRPGFFWSSRPWCDACDDKLKKAGTAHNICRRCGKFLTTDQSLCRECQEEEPPFFIARATGPYESCHRQVVKQYKFMEKRKLSHVMARMMSQIVLETPEYWPLDMVIPVPMSREGLIKRGFDQSELLASRIARRIGVRFEPHLLVRVKAGPPQRELSREMREKNLLHAFAVERPDRLRGKNVLLVDDVYTTGSTARECTRTLLGAGAKRVGVIAWAAGKGY